MSNRQAFCAIFSLTFLLSFCSSESPESISTDMAMTNVQAQDEDELKEIQELQNQIRRDKFDQILPQIMREHDIDMWIHVMREGSPDPMRDELGSNNGVFVFTDRGGDRIERAVIGHRWKILDQSLVRTPYWDVVQESGAYDIIAEEFVRQEKPGGPATELDHRFKGVGEFVAERDPKRIAVNYLEKLGPPVVYEIPRLRSDGISYTDYNLLVKALGNKFANRMISAEYLMYDYLSRRVPSEIEMFKKIRKWITESVEREFAKIVPGVTKVSDLEGWPSAVDKDGNRRRGDYVIQRGDLIASGEGRQSHHYLKSGWKFGNFYEVEDAYGYVLREGETEPPPKIKRAWADALKVRKILEDNIKVGRTAGETFEILKRKIDEAGFIYINTHDVTKELLKLDKTMVPLDLHALGKGIYAPRIGPIGPDWQRDLMLQLNHHTSFEYWVFVPMPEWGEGKYLSLRFHDGVIVTERGVEYFYPPPTELHIIY